MAMFTRAHALRAIEALQDLQTAIVRRGRGAPGLGDARLHAPAARAARLAVAPPAGLLLDVPARRARASRPCWGRPTELPLGAGALAGVNFPTDRGCVASRARLRGRRAELDRRRLQPRLRARLPRAPPRPARRTCRGWARRSCCGPRRSSASARCATPGRPARRSCRRRRTRTRPSCCARRRRGSSAHLAALHGVMHGAAADLQQGHAGGQGAPVRRGRHAGAVPGGRARDARRA